MRKLINRIIKYYRFIRKLVKKFYNINKGAKNIKSIINLKLTNFKINGAYNER